MKTFCIIGVAGFVAKLHLNSIKKIKGKLLAACDRHDNVGFLDNIFPKAIFFKNEGDFFIYIKRNKVDYLVICTPTHLHYRHIKLGLKSGSNVIVEKPPILDHNKLKEIYLLEKKYQKKCYCIFQLRNNDKIKILRKKIFKSNKYNNVKVHYSTYRGNWYFKTWKNIPKLSGGLLVNIGIHFFDILIWIFGDVKKLQIINKTKSEICGVLELTKAFVNWKLSTKKIVTKKNKKTNFERYMTVNNIRYEFNNFNDLHFNNYVMIIKHKKFHISEFEKTIKLINYISK
jgi:UDP-N-acetyl-2-amino-2-deoxyglucuronate dehydrogenase